MRKGRGGLWIARLSILQDWIKITDEPIVESGPSPTPAHCLGYACANGGGFMRGLLLDLVHKIFEIFDGDAVARTSRRNPGKIGISELGTPPCAHALAVTKIRRLSQRPEQAARQCVLPFTISLARGHGRLFFATGNFHCHCSFRRLWHCFLEPGGVFFARFHIAEYRATGYVPLTAR